MRLFQTILRSSKPAFMVAMLEAAMNDELLEDESLQKSASECD